MMCFHEPLTFQLQAVQSGMYVGIVERRQKARPVYEQVTQLYRDRERERVTGHYKAFWEHILFFPLL